MDNQVSYYIPVKLYAQSKIIITIIIWLICLNKKVYPPKGKD